MPLTKLARSALLGFAAASFGLGAEPPGATTFAPAVRWAGVAPGPAAPAPIPGGKIPTTDDLVTDQKGLAEAWRRRGLPGDPPEVDFATHLVVIVTAAGHPARVDALHVGPGGDATVESRVDGKAVKGTGYGVAVFPRARVRTVGGRKAAAAAAPVPPAAGGGEVVFEARAAPLDAGEQKVVARGTAEAPAVMRAEAGRRSRSPPGRSSTTSGLTRAAARGPRRRGRSWSMGAKN